MDEDASEKRKTARSFGRAADAYRQSTVHREGTDLETIARWCEGASSALDIGTGAGHTAHALVEAGVPTVRALDASHRMAATARAGDERVQVLVGDAERVPLRDDSMDAISCRLAGHHFPAAEAFVAEVARVLAPGGVLAFEDTVGPDDAAIRSFVERIERLRDPTHVTSHPVDRWREWFSDAGLGVEDCQRFAKRIPFDEWMAAQSVPADTQSTIESALLEAEPDAVEALAIERNGDTVAAVSLPKVLIRATAPG